jgi:hypothetical protein
MTHPARKVNITKPTQMGLKIETKYNTNAFIENIYNSSQNDDDDDIFASLHIKSAKEK